MIEQLFIIIVIKEHFLKKVNQLYLLLAFIRSMAMIDPQLFQWLLERLSILMTFWVFSPRYHLMSHLNHLKNHLMNQNHLSYSSSSFSFSSFQHPLKHSLSQIYLQLSLMYWHQVLHMGHKLIQIILVGYSQTWSSLQIQTHQTFLKLELLACFDYSYSLTQQFLECHHQMQMKYLRTYLQFIQRILFLAGVYWDH